MKHFKIIFLTIIFIVLWSCGTKEEVDEPVSEIYILKSIEEFQSTVDYNDLMKQYNASTQNINKQVDALTSDSEYENYSFNSEWRMFSQQLARGKEVFISDELKEIFNPDTSPCPLPKKVKNKLSKLREKNKNWAPSAVVEFLKTFPDMATKLEGESISALMHRVTIKRVDSSTYRWVLFGSPSFDNFSIDHYLVTRGYNSLLYTLDCSGYLNAAIEASATVPGADIKTQAKAALNTNRSMVVGGGVIMSPIEAAYYGNEAFGVNISDDERLGILNALLNIPNITDSDSIIVSTSYEVLWSSNQGDSGFNGKGEFTGKGRIGVGFAAVSASGNAGGEISRKSSFSTFNTYFTDRKRVDNQPPFTIAQVRKLVEELSSSDSNESDNEDNPS